MRAWRRRGWRLTHSSTFGTWVLVDRDGKPANGDGVVFRLVEPTDRVLPPRWWRVHNLIAHPLLVLWPRVGNWLHDRTAPPADQFSLTDHGWHEAGRWDR